MIGTQPPDTSADGAGSAGPPAEALAARLKGGARPYLLVALAVVTATAARLPFESFFQGRAPYAAYFLVVLGAAWHLGPGATVAATVLSLLVSWYVFVPAPFSFTGKESGSGASMILFAVVAGAMVALARGMRRQSLEALRTIAAEAEARQRLDVARSRLAAIVESSDDAIISKSLEGIIQTWNAGAERILGYTAEEIVGQSILRLIPPERHSEETTILARLRRGERVAHFETVRLAKDGRRVELSLTVSPLRDAAGRVVGASKVARDVTEQRRIERALGQQREWFRVTLASIGDGVITTDREARVTFMNPVAERLTGWPAAEAEGHPLTEIFKIEDEITGAPAFNPCETVLRTRQVVGLANHTDLVARDGSRRPIADSAAPIIDDQQQVIGVVLVFHDVTERRRRERERQAAATERERLLESERAARAEAERANRIKDDFVATLSHELRTPLTAILGWSQILQRKAGDAESVRRGVQIIERNTLLQTQLIADLLDMSRIVSGRMRLDLQASELVTVIRAALETVRPAAQNKKVQIVLDLQDQTDRLMIDPARMQQVVWNLLSNAIKFTPEGGRVRVSFSQDSAQAQITVDDTGIGIPADFLPHLFGRFRQADASSSRQYGGLGLGLAIVKELTELHGGTVSASSAGDGQGARFQVRLPVRPPAAAVGSGATGDSGRSADGARLAGLKVLVVEDDDDSRELLEQLLGEARVAVRAVGSAAQAMTALQEQPAEVIISDISMPGEDGYQLIQRVRALEGPQARPTPAIALTAFARPEDRARALAAGFQAHLAKPVDREDLLAALLSLAPGR